MIISVDTLRADHLPAYGYRGVETPNLDALRKDAVLFENAYSQVPLTLPSHTSLFTGLLPPQHGVRDNLGYALSTGPATLAGYLKSRGYATGAAVSSIVLSHVTGVGRGFDFYEDTVEPDRMSQTLSRVQRHGNETAALLSDWIGPHADQPFLAFLHLFEPHTPYEPPEPFESRYKLPYDGEIARADEIVGGFLKYLKDQEVYDRALIVFLSDHGEGLNDHGEDEHGVLLYREAIHVPLMVKFPKSRRAGESVSAPVALTDVFPTVAEVTGAPVPAGLAGHSLTATLPGSAAAQTDERRVYSETLYPRLHLGWSDLASLTDIRNQYIESPRPELYDIVADPGEKNDLSAGLPPAFRSMRAELARLPRPLQSPGSSDPEQVKKLAALGYISASTVDLSKKDLPAPRDRIGAVEQLKAGFTALMGRRYPEAAKILSALLEQEPGMTDVWQMYSEALMKLGRDKEALAALQTAARLSPGSPQVMMALSEYFMETGDFAEARRHAEAIGDAGTASPHENLARIALAEGDLAAAEKEARAALERYPARRVPRQILGKVLHDRGDYSGALAELDLASRPRAVRKHRPAAESAVPPRGLPGPPRPIPRGRGRVPGGDPGVPGQRRARAPRSRCSTRARGARPRRARRSPTSIQQLRTPEAYFAASRTYEVLGDPASAGPDSGRGEAPVSERQRPEHARHRLTGRSPRSVAEVAPLHLGRRPDSLQPEDRRRDVGQSAPGSERAALRAHDERHRVRRMGRVRLAGSGIDHLLGVAVIGGHHEDRAGIAAGRFQDSEAAVERLDGGDRLGELARVPDHVGVREIDDAGAEPAGGQGAHGLLGDLGRAHLRMEIVGRALPGGHEHAVLPGKRRLDAAVEEVRDVRVLLGLGEPQVLDARLGPDVREDVRQTLRRKGRGEAELLLVFGESHEAQPRGPGAREVGKRLFRQRARELPRPVGPEVEEDDRVALADRSHRLAVLLEDRGLHELVRLAAVVRRLEGGLRALGLQARGEDQRLVGARHAVPSLVAVHGVVTARHRGDLSSRARERRLEPAQVLARGLWRRVAAVEECVDADAGNAVLRGELEQARRGAARASARRRRRAVPSGGASLPCASRRSRPRAARRSRRTSRRGARGRCGGDPAAPCGRPRA